MNWIRSSNLVTLAVLFALAFAAVGTAGAISVATEDVPNESQVGESVPVTITIEDPFVDKPDTWTLRGSTELENVSWTVTILQQGDQIDDGESVYGEQSFEQALNASNGGDTIRVELTGETPAVENYTYDPAETYTLYDFDSITGSSESGINASEVHHYTNTSKQTREAIDGAAAAINETGGNQEAENLLSNAISAYDNDNFGNAQDLASEAETTAQQAEQSQEQTQMIMYGAVGLVVVLLIGGGVYYWRSQQNQPTKLQ